MSPFTLLFGTRMRLQEDPQIAEIVEAEKNTYFMEQRDSLRDWAKEAIAEIQKENKKIYNKKRKMPAIYKEGDLVAIKRTQRGPGLKLCAKFLGPYKVTHVLRGERYLIQKIGQGEGPKATSTSVDHM